ncbi:MAG: hypothetical protein N2C14_03730 [Planctomycetales bacterium]
MASYFFSKRQQTKSAVKTVPAPKARPAQVNVEKTARKTSATAKRSVTAAPPTRYPVMRTPLEEGKRSASATRSRRTPHAVPFSKSPVAFETIPAREPQRKIIAPALNRRGPATVNGRTDLDNIQPPAAPSPFHLMGR